ncbi:Crossover junction endonuclease mus81 [Coemansia sp. RSA 1358]|nr:Crossover junction endonuclease mus81 [Coemansia umbellata]KAJ2625720.1 Crossover junction endonuclease mus81 [Coemansia sp. RSA 1358]
MSESEIECANPLFLKWVNEWYQDACRRNAKTQFTLKKALKSLQRYPLRIENAQEAMQLEGIGQGIADRLAKKLASWQKENGIVVPQQQEEQTEGTGNNVANPKRRTPRMYVPRYRTGAFALLIGLYKAHCLYGQDYYVPRSELIPLCEQYTDTPFHVAGSSTGRGGNSVQHTAWSGIKTLESKSLVERQSGVKFCITEEGLRIAEKVVELLRTRNELPDEDNRVFTEYESRNDQESDAISNEFSDRLELASEGSLSGLSESSKFDRPLMRPLLNRAPSSSARASSNGFSRQSSLADIADIELADLILYPKADYDIILIVDSREVHSPADRALIQKELEDHGVHTEIRPLTVGDYLWIARTKATSANRHLPDIVLDYVVERKRMDDLCASIKDGRYREQHSRIHGTGFTNVFYVVEGTNPEAVSRLGENAVNTALSRIQVHHGFHLKRPPTYEATLRLLRQTTGVLQATLGDVYAIPNQFVGQKEFAQTKKSIRSRFPNSSLAMSFEAYDVVSNKSGTLCVGEIYLRMLMTMRGVSADKALTIARRHQTLEQLLKALKAQSGRKELEEIVVDGTCRKIGPALAKRIAEFWTLDAFD